MSEFVKLFSACGRKYTWCDIFDLEENPHGSVCCEECKTIIARYEAQIEFQVDQLLLERAGK